MGRITQYVAFCDFFSVSLLVLRFSHVAGYISTPFFFIAEYYSIG